MYTVREESRAAVDEFAELGHSLNEMRVDELKHPLRRLLAKLRLQLDFKNTIPGSRHQFYADTNK